MKILAKFVIAISTIILCSGVQAAPSFDLPFISQGSADNYTTLSTQSRGGWRSWRIWRWWRPYRPHRPSTPSSSPRAVPELDAAVAPLALMLLGGLVAAGAERRRRKTK